MNDTQPGGSFDARNRLPWLVAAGAIVFALVVLIRSELQPGGDTPPASPATPTPRVVAVTRTPATDRVPQGPGAVVSPSATPAPATPKSSPTPAAATYSLSGIVTNLDGKPISNATLKAVYAHQGSQLTLNATTDAGGAFTLTGFRSPDIEVLIAEAAGHGRGVLEKIKLPLPDRLEIALGALAGLQINVMQATEDGRELAPFRGEADFVLLQQRNSEPSTSTLGLAEPARRRQSFVPVAQQHVKIDDGTLRLEELETGTYKASIRSKDAYAESAAFNIQGAHQVETTVTLGLKYPVSGWVAAEGDLHPLARAYVHAQPVTEPSTANTVTQQTGEDGRFVIPGLSSGSYRLMLWASGFTTKTVEAIEITSNGAPAETTYTLTQQQPAIRVTVIDGDGQPMREARLVLMLTHPVNKTIFSKSDDAGTRVFENVTPGSYTIAVTTPGERARQKSTELTLSDGETTDVLIAFPRTTYVKGHARKDGKPYQGLVAFTLRGSVGLQTIVKTDETGGYAADLEPGEYMVGSPEQPSAQVVVVGVTQQSNIDVEVR